MSLVTRCPKCQSDFIVSLEQLRVHDGLVRCGSCTRIFDGQAALESRLPVLTQRAENLGEILAPAVLTTSRVAGHALSPPLWQEPEQTGDLNRVDNRLSVRSVPRQAPSAPSVLRRRSQTGAELEPEPNGSFAASQPEPLLERESVLRVQGEARLRGETRLAAGRGTPDFLIDETPLDGLRRGLWLLLAVLAGALLLMQLMYVFRNELVTRVPSLLPMARAACVHLKCEVSFVRHLDRITIDSTALEQLAAGQADGQSNSLTLKFSMRNRSDKIQPWPHLLVELKDASGTPVLRKVLAPELYLPGSMASQPFGAQQEVHLSMPLVVTGLEISGVQLNRFFP
jgi:predicted Zn finger-like uncharacterized protein